MIGREMTPHRVTGTARAGVRAPARLGVVSAFARLGVVSALALALLVAGLPVAPERPAATAWAQTPAPFTAEERAAAEWLARELGRHGGRLPGSGGGVDWGLTADAVLALAATGVGVDAGRQAADELTAHLGDYVTWDAAGSRFAGVVLAGPLAKVLLVTAVQGRGPGSLGGRDAEAVLRDLMLGSGPQAGRFADRNPHSSDLSNGVGQSLALMALGRTDRGAPPAAVAFLLDQQCADGGFRLFFGDTRACGDSPGDVSDTDTTAFAIQGLLAVERTPAVAAALADAVAWLMAIQRPDGAFGGTGPTAGPNANSTGLAAQALRAAGRVAAADAAATAVAALQLDAARTAGSPAAGDRGAIAYNAAAREDALESGIGEPQRDQWRRASAQAVLAFGAPTLGALQAPPPRPGVEVRRLSGTDRIATAVALSRAQFPDGGAGGVVLARADAYPDALAGAPLAHAIDGPLLLTPTHALHATAAAELDRVLDGRATVYLLGGAAALSADVEHAVRARGHAVVRLSGTTRFDTAVAIARHLGDPSTVLVTTGLDFPDALAAGSAAVLHAGAVLLTPGERRHPVLDAYLAEHRPARLWAIGGPAARAYPDADPVFGPTREGTAVAVAETFFDRPTAVGVARRDGFADALAGGAHSGRAGAPLLLTPTGRLAGEVEAYLCAVDATSAFVYGGTAAIDAATEEEVAARLRGCDR